MESPEVAVHTEDALNQRSISNGIEQDLQRRVSILTDFPDSRFEAIIVQWSQFRPTVLIQLKYDLLEPLKFPGQRLHVPGNAEMPKDLPNELDNLLLNFIDPTTGRLFHKKAYEADLLLSVRSFNLIQPDPALVLPDEMMWECRREALNAIGVSDETGLEKVKS